MRSVLTGDTGWPRPLGCLKLQVVFRTRATNYRALLREMTYKGRAPYEINASRRQYYHLQINTESLVTLRIFHPIYIPRYYIFPPHFLCICVCVWFVYVCGVSFLRTPSSLYAYSTLYRFRGTTFSHPIFCVSVCVCVRVCVRCQLFTDSLVTLRIFRAIQIPRNTGRICSHPTFCARVCDVSFKLTLSSFYSFFTLYRFRGISILKREEWGM